MQILEVLVVQEQILVQVFQVYLTLVFMLEVVAVDQDVVNLKEEMVDLVEAVTEKEELTKHLDQMQVVTQVAVEVVLVEISVLIEMDLMVDLV